MHNTHSPLPTLKGASAHHQAFSKHDKEIRKQAQHLVSQTFFGTMLKQMRDSPFKSQLFSGGRGGEAFSQMLDQRLSERMARGAGNKLTDAIYNSLKRHSAARNGQQDTNEVNLESSLKNGASVKPPATDWRMHVSADIRA